MVCIPFLLFDHEHILESTSLEREKVKSLIVVSLSLIFKDF